MPVRLAEVAARAGVSQSTVSRVLNGRPVAPGTRELVLTALDVLGFQRPPPVGPAGARGLVGMVVPELTNPVFPRFAAVLETHLAAAGLTPLLCTLTPGGVHEDAYVRILRAHRAAGIVFVSGVHANREADPARYTELTTAGIPFVLVNGFLADVDAPAVSHDDAAGVRIAVAHLRQLGHERVALAVGPDRYTPARRRIDAFVALLGPDALVATTQYTVEGGRRAAGELLDAGATAVVCGSDLMAVGVVQGVRDRGLRVPEDVSVVGSDDSSLVRFLDPPLTTVRMDVSRIGAAAVQALLDEMSGPSYGRAEFLFPPELVLRSSTAAAPGRSGR